MRLFLENIVQNPKKHVLWLNTLSFLENCGARKIAAYEHPTLVRSEMLKHAAEEFRHAHYLKAQIAKISPRIPPDYSSCYMLGGHATRRYLDKIELAISRFAKPHGYALITYAIEKRAEMLYPLYHDVLVAHASKVRVKSIVLEEEEHLREMEAQITTLANGEELKQLALEVEARLFGRWKEGLH